jgi:RNA polymerase sigma-70 factor (ECF subfamily)
MAAWAVAISGGTTIERQEREAPKERAADGAPLVRAGDGGLAARAALGDREAFADLFGAYAEPVTRLCRRMLGSEEDARDARSEVFLRAREALAGYDPQRPFQSWLLAIAAHHCVDQLRRRAVEGRLFEPADLDEATLPSAAPSPLGSALAREERDQLLAALDALPTRHRAPLVLRYFAELPYAAMAELLGVGVRDVGVLLFRAKLRLRAALGGGE